MPRNTRMVVIVACCFSLAEFVTRRSFAGDKPITLTGIISDSMCGAKHMISGDDANCARTCFKNGSQHALVVKDNVYKLDGKSDELDKLAGQVAIVTGKLSGDGIQVASVALLQSGRAGSNRLSPNSHAPGEVITIEGLVRDLACPIQNKEATARRFNLKCAQDCAKLGSPLIVLTDDGTLYTPISESMPDTDQRQRLMPFLGKYVRVRGQVFERAGTHAIAIKEIVELKEVHLITDAK